MIPKFNDYFDHPTVDTEFEGPSKTEQSHENEVDINQIVARAKRTGVMPGNAMAARYGDFTNAEDFMQIQNRIITAEKQFEALPVAVRERFGNDISKLIDFIANERNREEAEKLGIVEKKKPVTPPAPEPEPKATEAPK